MSGSTQELVSRLLAARGGKVEALAAELGLSPSTVWRWSTGATDPHPSNRALLEEASRRDYAAQIASDIYRGGHDADDS